MPVNVHLQVVLGYMNFTSIWKLTTSCCTERDWGRVRTPGEAAREVAEQSPEC